MNQLDSMYKEIILEHSKDPRNFGSLPQAELCREGHNPMCGDRVEVCVKLDEAGAAIEKCQFTGEGCSICMASSSIMTEELEGKNLDEAQSEIQKFRGLMQGEVAPEAFDSDVEALAGVRNFPVRIKCALLSWTTLKDAIDGYRAGKGASDGSSKTE